MVRKDIPYEDYEGNEQVETAWFNLTKAEVLKMDITEEGGLYGMMRKAVDSSNSEEILRVFENLISKSYGQRSSDGKKFIKNDVLREEFLCSEAYSELFIELSTNVESAVQFFAGIMPKGMNDVIEKILSQKDISQEEMSAMMNAEMVKLGKAEPESATADVVDLVSTPVVPDSANIDAMVEQRARELVAKDIQNSGE